MSVAMATKDEKFSKENLAHYLKVYNADIDWDPHLGSLREKLNKKFGAQSAKEMIRKQIACTILLPVYDKSAITTPPENLLFWCSSYDQYKSRDWVAELEEVWKRDEKIKAWRSRALDMGIIMPFQYVTIAKQAFNWLMDKVENVQGIQPGTPEHTRVKEKMQWMVYAYGGAVICNTFMKPEYATKIKKIPNWRSGYFFERLIFDVYKEEEVFRIKEHELNRLDPNLVKKIVK